jgi:hypothetical protein
MRDYEPRTVWMSPLITHYQTRGVGRLWERRRGSRRGVREGTCIGDATMYATALDIEVDQQRCCLGCYQSDFTLQAVVECCALEPECFRVDVLR